MTTRVIRDPNDIAGLARLLSARNLPVTVTITAGASRTDRQNRLMHRWFDDVSKQLGDMTREEVRAYCKLHFGVPILRAENEAFKLAYDGVMLHLPYEAKLAFMQHMQLPVTSLMTVKQQTAMLDEMAKHWSAQGVRLTDPAALQYEEEFK